MYHLPMLMFEVCLRHELLEPPRCCTSGPGFTAWRLPSSGSSAFTLAFSMCCPHSVSEFELATLYPGVGGVSGICIKSLSRALLKELTVFARFISPGIKLKSLGALWLNELKRNVFNLKLLPFNGNLLH